MTDKLIQKADCGLRCVVTVRYDIVCLTHMVQVFDETDIQFVCYFHIVLFHSTECLQCYHFAHEFDIIGRDRFCEQIAFVAILFV